MESPAEQFYVEGSAKGRPHTPPSDAPARPIIHLVGVCLMALPVLVLGPAVAIENMGWVLSKASVWVVAGTFVASLLWLLFVVALWREMRSTVATIRRRRAVQPS